MFTSALIIFIRGRGAVEGRGGDRGAMLGGWAEAGRARKCHCSPNLAWGEVVGGWWGGGWGGGGVVVVVLVVGGVVGGGVDGGVLRGGGGGCWVDVGWGVRLGVGWGWAGWGGGGVGRCWAGLGWGW